MLERPEIAGSGSNRATNAVPFINNARLGHLSPIFLIIFIDTHVYDVRIKRGWTFRFEREQKPIGGQSSCRCMRRIRTGKPLPLIRFFCQRVPSVRDSVFQKRHCGFSEWTGCFSFVFANGCETWQVAVPFVRIRLYLKIYILSPTPRIYLQDRLSKWNRRNIRICWYLSRSNSLIFF